MTIQEYLPKLSVTQLQVVLKEECAGRGCLPPADILTICDLLAEKDPKFPNAKELLLQICQAYLP